MLNQHGTILAELMAGSERHVVAELDENGMVVDCSVGFVQLLGRREKPIGVAFGQLFAGEQPAPSPVCPAEGYQVVYVRPPGIRTRLQAQVVRSASAYLVVAEQLNLEQDVVEKLSKLNDEMTNLMRELHKEKAELQRSIARIRRLEGIISICSYCHRIRNEQRSWQRLEAYLVDHSDAQFSHGICPECFEQHFGPHDE
jgi:hypothetical protein